MIADSFAFTSMSIKYLSTEMLL